MYSSVPSPPNVWNPGPAPSLERARSGEPLPIAPTSPRSGRLRGLSLLRNYTQNHILSRDGSNSSSQQRPPIVRASSHPSPTISRGTTASPTPPQPSAPGQTSPAAQRSPAEPSPRISNPENIGSTSGWLPTVGGQSGVSRTASEPQSTATASSSAVLSGNGQTAVASDLTASMARTRSATVTGATDTPAEGAEMGASNEAAQNGSKAGMNFQLPSIKFTAHNDVRASRPSLVFTPMSRILPTGKEVIKVGRYSERDNPPQQAVNVPSSAPVGFKSKVVSRRHCEFYCSAGKWYIRDVKSSSGTFLNHIRLSSPGTESRPFPVNDGDIVQLGIDFKGGEEMIFRCVKIRIELNKGWQTGPTSFNVASHKRLRELNSQGKASSSQDCSICLGPIAPCQSLFVAPCSHTWHYKCIRVIINGAHYPHFICPNCRTVADLEAELDDIVAPEDWEEVEAPEADTPTPAAPPTPATTSHISNQMRARDTSTNETGGTAVENELSEPELLSVPTRNSGSGPQVGTIVEEDQNHSDSTDSETHPISNATVAPVDIVVRRPSAAPSRNGHEESTLERHSSVRTPSPNRLGSSLGDPSPLVEGPMTPRNDVGPFVFDGSAGRGEPAVNLAAMASMDINDEVSPATSDVDHVLAS